MLARARLNVKARPVTSMALIAVAAYSLWIGYVIHHYTLQLPPSRLTGYSGPMGLASLNAWSWAYLGVGVLMLARLSLLAHPRADLVAHVFCMVPIVAWAVAFDVGPATTGQPCYTLVAAILVMIPFITQITERGWREKAQLYMPERSG